MTEQAVKTLLAESGSAKIIFSYLQIYKMYLMDNNLDDDTGEISAESLIHFVNDHISEEDVFEYQTRLRTLKEVSQFD